MAAFADSVLDSGLSTLNTATETLHILSQDIGLTWADVATYTLGNKASPTVSTPADRGAGGREVTVSAITDGTVTGTGTASHWALTDDSATAVLASGPLASSQAVTSGNVFTLTSFTAGIADPT